MDLVESFEKLGKDEIEEFIKRGQEEHLHLDFKIVTNANLASRDDKRNLAIALSGFANSSGGVIVWGVDARKNKEGINRACGAVEISSLRLFLSRLNELTGEALSPIAEGVRHRSIETSADKGFALTLVPESNGPPHMAKLGEDRYYKRSGDSFYRMEHFDLEDMFGRRQKPRLQMFLKRIQTGDDVEELSVFVSNDGRGIAKHVSVFMELSNAEITSADEDLRNASALNDGRPVATYSNNNAVIHPNSVRVSIGSIKYRRTRPDENITVKISSVCENAQIKTEDLVFEPFPRVLKASQINAD